jgi:hypothetical protein
MKITVSGDMTCSLVDHYQTFYQFTLHHIPEDSNLHVLLLF